MSQFPSVTGREVIAALSKVDFELARVRGSHQYYNTQRWAQDSSSCTFR